VTSRIHLGKDTDSPVVAQPAAAQQVSHQEAAKSAP
jgi:hypothetical protein